ncbi:MAG: porin family protein [Flavobacteriaceae bacterium]|jgi:opacity protein-like surface antigen|nr:porin family protein [Flavobacteriaceae bacterium]
MKKIILSILAVVAFGTANAQDIKFGAKAGLNISNLTGDTEDTKSKIGFHLGGVIEIKITDKFSVQPELLFSTQGAKYEESESFGGESYKYETTMKLNYLNIPIMAKYYVAENFSILAGPQVGFLMSAKADWEETYSFGGTTESDSGEEDVKDFYKGIDFGLNLGLGYDFTENIFVEARYNLGLSNIADVDNYKEKNSVFQISLGYRF